MKTPVAQGNGPPSKERAKLEKAYEAIELARRFPVKVGGIAKTKRAGWFEAINHKVTKKSVAG